MTDHRTPTIEGQRVLLVPFAEQHLTASYVNWLNDPAVVRFSDQRHRAHTFDSCREYMLSFHGEPNHFWALLRQDREFDYVGTMTAYIDESNRVADLGILIGDPNARGQGYGLDAWLTTARYLFDGAGMRKLTAGMLAVNTAMLKLVERAGMVADGCRIRHALFEGAEVDVLHFASFRAG